jgi:hypothetical protein
MAQEKPVQRSEHGWYLSPSGTIRVLVLFAEIEYDVDRSKDPQPDGAEHWPKGRLPKWSDELFDPQAYPVPQAVVSRYYHDISLGHLTVLGDYMDEMLTLKESEHSGLANGHGINRLVIKEANERGGLRTRNGLSVADFDLWKRGGRPGMPKVSGADEPHSYDHVMVILRNSTLTHGQGSVEPGSSGKLFGYESDSQSRFGGMNALPFEILKHEFNHLFLGGNNFHSGGGNAPHFQGYFIALQGGWSMMGGASSSLLTCTGWDRDRLGWQARDACSRINARDLKGGCVRGDLDPVRGDTGTFVLRDFITSGDALRIRMPYLDSTEYPQFLWLENHQGWRLNGSPTDRFHYELEMACVQGMVPGILAVMQVDRETKVGANIYSGHSDYLRALPASGFHDMFPRGDTVTFQCLWPGPIEPLVVKDRWQNPLTGASELEIPLFDRGRGDVLLRAKDGIIPRVEERNGRYLDEAMFFGHARQVFTPTGNNELGKSTNPSLTNMMTFTSTSGRASFDGKAPDNRVVHLSDIRVKVQEQRADGSIVVHVGVNDVLIDRDVRWCADSIVLHAPQDTTAFAAYVQKGRTVRIDRATTPTRINHPDTVKGKRYFNSPTSFVVARGARLRLESKAELAVLGESTLHLMPGSMIDLHPKARLTIDRSSRIVLHGDAAVHGTKRQMKRLRKGGRMEQRQ